MTNTKARHLEILDAAYDIIETAKVDITEAVDILPLAKQLAEQTGCHITTAKKNVAKAIRQKRGQLAGAWGDEPQGGWGGYRPGAGRPSKTTE